VSLTGPRYYTTASDVTPYALRYSSETGTDATRRGAPTDGEEGLSSRVD